MRTKEQYLNDFKNGNNPFPVTADEVKWFEEATKDVPDVPLPDVLQSYWSMMVNGYLKREVKKGTREFRIAMQDDKRFIIHPLGRDGETLDMSL